MIKIIKRGNVSEEKQYKVTCSQCNTIFICDEHDFHPICVGHGEFPDAITCPVCQHTCTGLYTDDIIEQI